MTWVCDECYSAMEEKKEGRNRYRVECPTCGRYWIVNNDDEIIDSWSPFGDGDDEDDDDECISVYDAAMIWASHGKDEDYMFGYGEEELENAL